MMARGWLARSERRSRHGTGGGRGADDAPVPGRGTRWPDDDVPFGRRTRRRLVAAWLTLTTLLAVVLPLVRPRTGELPVYTMAAERMVRGEAMYRPSDLKPFTYPPFFALPFVPLTLLPDVVRASAWYFTNLMLLAAVVALVLRRLWPILRGSTESGAPPRSVFVILILVLSGRHLISPIEYQSHDLLLGLMLVLGIDAWADQASRRAGFWIGLGTACKATPLLFLPVFLWQREVGGAWAMAATAMAATLLPDLLFPRVDGGLWVTAWYQTFASRIGVGNPADVEGAWQAWNHLNQSLSGTIYRLSTPVPEAAADRFDVSLWNPGPPGVRAATILAQGAVVAVLAWGTWRGHRRRLPARDLGVHRWGEGAAVLSAMLLLSPMSSKQHFAVLVVPLAFCAADFLHRRRSAVVGGLLGLVVLFGTLTTKDVVGRAVGNRLLAYGSLTVCALAALLATAYVLAERSRFMRRAAASVVPGRDPERACGGTGGTGSLE